MEESKEIFNAIVNNIEDGIHSSIQSAIQSKFDQAMDVKRVAVASEIYNKIEENIEIHYKKGKSSKKEIAKFKNQNEFEKWFGNQEDDIDIVSHKGLKD